MLLGGEHHDMRSVVPSADIAGSNIVVHYAILNRGTRTEVVSDANLVFRTLPPYGETFRATAKVSRLSVQPDADAGGGATAELFFVSAAPAAFLANERVRGVDALLQLAATPRTNAREVTPTELRVAHIDFQSGTPKSEFGYALFGNDLAYTRTFKLNV